MNFYCPYHDRDFRFSAELSPKMTRVFYAIHQNIFTMGRIRQLTKEIVIKGERMMKKYLTIMLAALMFCAMSFTVAGNAWGAESKSEASASANGERQKSDSAGNVSWDGSAIRDAPGANSFEKVFNAALGGLKIGGGYRTSSDTYTQSADQQVRTQTPGATPGTTPVGGVGGGFTMPNLGFSGGSGIFSTAISKLLNLFGNVKLLLYVLAAFGLVGFAFMAIFGKVRWGWVCALAFGLAAVAAAGQVIDYVTQAGIGGAMVDTLGANGVDW